ncbi:exported hypothetical protein [Candidatus Sulfopaludibacter sp. SbA4]|nr:exported hypothetical protein [Candidatus Sulfopaludibacter sp. SbA4]
MRCAAALLLIPLAAGMAQVPTPESVLGHKPGDDFYLASYDEALGYLQKLAQATNKLKLVRVGKTTQGRDWYIAVISSPANLAGLDKYKDTARRLALVKGLTDAQAHDLAQNGKVIVHIDGGLHATEVACAQHTIQLAYNLVTATDPATTAILDNVILLLWFSINPDGQNMTVNWYRSNVGTPYEVSGMPALWQEYIGHDNRARQQPRRVHEQHDRVAGDHARGAGVLPGGFLQPSPDGALSGAHLDSAVRGPGVVESAPADVPVGERVRGGDGGVAGRAQHAGRDASRAVRRLVSGLCGPCEQFPEYGFVPDGDGALPLRDAAFLYHRRFSTGEAGSADRGVLFEPVDRGLVAAGRCGAVHAGRVDGGAGYGGQESGRAAVRPVSRGARRGGAVHQGSALCVHHPARAEGSADGGVAGGKADDRRDRGAPGDARVHGQSRHVQGRRLGGADGPAVRGAGEGAVRCPEVSGVAASASGDGCWCGRWRRRRWRTWCGRWTWSGAGG